MARPQLYHSEEEKKAANRAKSKRHYEKVKDILLAKRRKARALSERQTSPKKALKLPACSQQKDRTDLSETDRAVACWIERSSRIQKRLYARSNGPLVGYLERLYLKYISNEDKTSINEALTALHILRDGIYQCEDKILSLVGITDTYHQVKEISKQVINAVNWVDELYVYTHLGLEEFQQTHKDKEFLYQAA